MNNVCAASHPVPSCVCFNHRYCRPPLVLRCHDNDDDNITTPTTIDTSAGDDAEDASSGSDDAMATSMEGMITTRPLPYDADASVLATALSEDLNLTTASVSVDCCDAQGGRKWTLELNPGACTS